MLPANRHLLPVIGIDIHIVLIAGVPTPVPHPFIGLVFDVSDYIPFIGSTININGVPRGNSSVSGMLVIKNHIPLGGPFSLPFLIGHNSVNFFGSLTVKAQDALLSAAGYMVMSCNDIRTAFNRFAGEETLSFVPQMYLPTSMVIPLPGGNPVNVGGPYVPDWESMKRTFRCRMGFGGLFKVVARVSIKSFASLMHTGTREWLCKILAFW